MQSLILLCIHWQKLYIMHSLILLCIHWQKFKKISSISAVFQEHVLQEHASSTSSSLKASSGMKRSHVLNMFLTKMSVGIGQFSWLTSFNIIQHHSTFDGAPDFELLTSFFGRKNLASLNWKSCAATFAACMEQTCQKNSTWFWFIFSLLFYLGLQKIRNFWSTPVLLFWALI